MLLRSGGDPARSAWHTGYETLAQWQAPSGNLLAEQEHVDMVAKHIDSFLPGSEGAGLWRTI